MVGTGRGGHRAVEQDPTCTAALWHCGSYRQAWSGETDITTSPYPCAGCRDDGVGLAAPQIGMNIRMMVFNPHGRAKQGCESILVNPGERQSAVFC